MATKKLKFTVFDIENKTATNDKLDLAAYVNAALDKTEKLKERIVQLNKEDSNDVDLVSKYRYKDGFLHGIFIRLNNKEDSILKVSDLEKKTVELSEIVAARRNESAGTIKSTVFFCIYKDIIIIAPAHNMKKPLLEYLQWIVSENVNKDINFDFTKKLNQNSELPLNEVSSVKIGDNAFVNSLVKSGENSKRSMVTKFKNVAIDMVRSLLGSTSIDSEELDKIVSAYLVVKFNKKEVQKYESLKAAIGLVDDDNVIVSGRKGARYKGSSFVISVDEEIEITSDGVLNEFSIEMSMKKLALMYTDAYEKTAI